jgi:hypothetical protein
MTIPELIYAIGEKHKNDKFVLHPPVPEELIKKFEKYLGFTLPGDFKTFYSFCNGFEMDSDDIFRMIDIEEIIDHKNIDKKAKTFHFAEYMTYSDMWTLKYMGEGEYKIVNFGITDTVLTDSVAEFLTRYLEGGVFEERGLIDWHEEIKRAAP